MLPSEVTGQLGISVRHQEAGKLPMRAPPMGPSSRAMPVSCSSSKYNRNDLSPSQVTGQLGISVRHKEAGKLPMRAPPMLRKYDENVAQRLNSLLSVWFGIKSSLQPPQAQLQVQTLKQISAVP